MIVFGKTRFRPAAGKLPFAAVLRGLREAHAAGFTHALTMDADGQHAAERIPEFVERSCAEPGAMILGVPIFDASAPAIRIRGRKISNWFANQLKIDAPDFRAVGGRLIQALRYGENPHQSASFYKTPERRPGVATARQLQGKELSYNNINDTDAAYECIAEFDAKRTPACVIVKHANPCGVAEGKDLVSAYRKALACDSTSAYGGIVALNRTLDAEAARAITEIFTEVIIAPNATEEAAAIVGAKKNLRLLVAGGLPDPRAAGLLVKSVAGGLLVALPGVGHASVAVACVLLALLGRGVAQGIPPAPATDPNGWVTWNGAPTAAPTNSPSDNGTPPVAYGKAMGAR